MNALVDHEWPFNIAGLKHVIDKAVALCDGPEIRDEHILLDVAALPTRGTLNLLRFRWGAAFG